MTKNNNKIESNQIQALVAGFFGETVQYLAHYLEKILPTLFKDWWNEAVVSKLSFQQRRRAEQCGLNSLTSLDIAALLRVLDQNWYQISIKMNLPTEARHFVKEMQTVRNRWAHAGAEGFPIDDVYRDLDTLQRFAATIEAEQTFIQQIQNAKISLLTLESDRQDTKTDNSSSNPDKESIDNLEPGQIVFLKTNPAIRGAIVGIIPGNPEARYHVFINGETQIFYASQIQLKSKDKESLQFLPCHQFNCYLTALQLRHPGLSTLYSLNTARIDFIPYQFRPVLKFIRSDRPRLLIADSVGVGKTIEAGLILRELQARSDVRSVLIICPRPLVTERKWLTEMKRFEERFSHLDGSTLRFCVNEMDMDGAWPEQYLKVIIPYTLFDEALLYGTKNHSLRKSKKGLLELDPPPRFDLVIVDEAHHIRNPETFSHKAVQFFCDHAEAVIFLTATPIQLGNQDLFVLLNILRPDLIIDKESFEHMAEPNPFINRAIATIRAQQEDWSATAATKLDHAVDTSWGRVILHNNPDFIQIRDRLSKGDIPLEERVKLITGLESLHTFSGIINRTRRRDIGAFTIRKPVTKIVNFTPAQKQLHDDLLQVQAEIFRHLHWDINVGFLMTTIRRQAASCLYGLVPLLQDILNRHIDELAWEEADSMQKAPSSKVVEAIETRIQNILEQAKGLDPLDPKLNALKDILRGKQKLSNNKVMLFSSFRHTLYYLYQHLQDEHFRVGLIHGDTPDEQRRELRERFARNQEDDDALDVLLFSEVGCEGLDYQFCDCIVNYDLPWNPMRIEQRIGRIDRNGQKSESIAIFNLITPGTVDFDIYDRCLLRIGVFNHALGDNEEILGEISQEIKNIAADFALTDEDRKEKFQQLADNKVRLIMEQEKFEQKQQELFGIRLPADQMKKEMEKEIEEASSFWLSPDAIRNLGILYLQKTCGSSKEQEYILGDKPLKTLRLSQEARSRLLKDFRDLPRQNLSSYRHWETWLKGGDPHLSITFDAACASSNPKATFITPLHPLVRQAARTFNVGRRVITCLRVLNQSIPDGSYPFAIYQWQFHGIKEDLILYPVASSDQITKVFAKLLEKAKEDQTNERMMPDTPVWDELDSQHYIQWTQARERHIRRTQELAQYRRESLLTSHRARILLLEEQLAQATDEKIQRMRQSQISAAEADYARRIQEIDIAMERADITAQPVAHGIIRIQRNETDE